MDDTARGFRMTRVVARLGLVVATAGLLGACGQGVADYPYRQNGEIVYGESYGDVAAKRQTIWGEGGLSLFGNDKNQGDGGAGLGVNSYLWRASLDTIAFLPVTSADPFGGVIITDWHSPSAVPEERFKMNVYILGRALRADGVRVSLFRQVRAQGGEWRDAGVPDGTSIEIENAILTRARQLRNETIQE